MTSSFSFEFLRTLGTKFYPVVTMLLLGLCSHYFGQKVENFRVSMRMSEQCNVFVYDLKLQNKHLMFCVWCVVRCGTVLMTVFFQELFFLYSQL